MTQRQIYLHGFFPYIEFTFSDTLAVKIYQENGEAKISLTNEELQHIFSIIHWQELSYLVNTALDLVKPIEKKKEKKK